MKKLKSLLLLVALAALSHAAKSQSVKYTPVFMDSLPFDILIGNNKAGSIDYKTANTFLGFRAAYSNTTGNHSTGIGSGALFSNTTGTHNTALGVSTLRYSTTGSRNTAIGMGVLRYNSTGYRNTGTGNDALRYNTTGYNNTAIGAYTLRNNISGVNNTALGHNAFSQLSSSYSNSTALGANTIITASNQVRIGDANVRSIIGQVNFSAVSDGRFKKDISSVAFKKGEGGVPGLDFILRLRPVTYRMDMDKIADFLHTATSMRNKELEASKGATLQTGFIGQEVEKAAAELGFNFSGVDKPKNETDYYGLRYAEFVVPLVKAVQEQQELINQLRADIIKLQTDLNKMKLR